MKDSVDTSGSESLGQTVARATVETEAIRDLGFDLAEIAIDQVMDGGILREVPIFGAIAAAVKGVQNVRDRLLVKKVYSFLLPLANLPQTERDAFARKHLDDPKKAKKLGEALVLILDTFDDFEKPPMLAKMYAALVRGKIRLDTFRRLAAAIDIGFADDLKNFAIAAFDAKDRTNSVLTSTGLVRFTGDGTVADLIDPRMDPIHAITPLGTIFIGCMNETYQFDAHL